VPLRLAEMAGAPVYIVHLSCNDALESSRARDRGLRAYAETCPQYLYLSLENMKRGIRKHENTSSLHRFAKNGTRKSCGKDSRRMTCR